MMRPQLISLIESRTPSELRIARHLYLEYFWFHPKRRAQHSNQLQESIWIPTQVNE